ncbi:hypothetical protein Tco_0319491 [Tanacetum coccineum]
MGSFIKWYCKRIGKSNLTKADLEGPVFKLLKPFHKNNISLQFQMEECHMLLTDNIDLTNPEGNRVVPDVSKPLPPGGPPGQVTIQLQHFFNKNLEYLISGDKDKRQALSISKLKAAYYQDFRLEELVPHIVPSDRHVVRSHMKIPNVNLYPNDFEDMYLLHLQGKLNHLSGSDKTNLNLTEPSWDATDFLFKEDYTIISKPRVVIYRDRNNKKNMIRETEVHKFSDGTLTRILEKLDHMVKDFRLFKYNSGMENRIWSEDDKRRSKEFMEVTERRLKIRRIFRNLESFVSGRLRDVDYTLI